MNLMHGGFGLWELVGFGLGLGGSGLDTNTEDK